MKKTIDLGLTIAPMRGSQCSRMSVTVTFGDNREKPEEGYFSVTGEFSNHGSTWQGGQCLDEIKESIRPNAKNKALFDEIYELWKKYHLKYCTRIPEPDCSRIIEIIKK